MSTWPFIVIGLGFFSYSLYSSGHLTREGRAKRKLAIALTRQDLQTVQKIVSEGFDLNYLDSGTTPLCRAIRHNFSPAVKLLIEHGASIAPNIPGNQGLLIDAVDGGNRELIEMALVAGHNIHIRPQNRSCTPLDMAVRRNSPEMIRYLFGKGATKDDLKLVHWYKVASQTIRTLLDLGVEVPEDVLTAVREGKWDMPVVNPP